VVDAKDGLAARLTEVVRRRLGENGDIALRVPEHEAVSDVLGRVSGPVLLWPLAVDGQPATTAEQAATALGERGPLVVDGGPCRFGQPTTAVRIDAGGSWSVVRAGVASAEYIERQCAALILFVCTGNTCRSPLAEALCKKMLADRLGCGVDELPRRGFLVISAGLTAMMGGGAAPEAVMVAAEHGADLVRHRSQPLTSRLLAQADAVVVMTHAHAQALALQYPGLGPVPRLLRPDGSDLADPVGGDGSIYRACAAQIRSALDAILPEFLQP
jgi:protein-tyrosine phosphatase